MLSVMMVMVLQLHAPSRVRLVAEEPAPPRYELLSRSELQALYDGLEAKRPGIVAPVLLTTGGGLAAIIIAVAFWIPFSTPYGVAVYMAVIAIAAFVVSLAAVAAGAYLFIRDKPARDTLGRQMKLIEDAYRDGRCRNVAGERPCRNDPSGPPPAAPAPYDPQVSAPLPSLVLASF